jgi:hypothetical protein
MESFKYLRYIAITGDAIYVLWILRNGINEGFHTIKSVQAISLSGLLLLLALNLYLLWKQK